MNSISSWLCTNSSKNLFVKIVHPGGHVELHDRPILAAELLNRNPKCCVAHPTVFQKPHAILSPETTLVLGQKYYVVPLGTIRKLQLRYKPSVPRESQQAISQENSDHHRQSIGEKTDDDSSVCWLFRNSKNDAKEKNGNSGCCLQSMSSGIRFRAGNSESSKEEMKAECGRKKANNNKDSSSSSGRLSLASLDNWHPGLESVTEEIV